MNGIRFRLVKNLIFSLIPLGVLLLVVEAALTCFDVGKPFTPAFSEEWAAFDLMQPDPQVGARMKPNYSRNSIRLNSLGLRNSEIDPKAPVKILSLGDSCAFGWMIDKADETYASRLETYLNEKTQQCRNPSRTQVVNAGVPSYSVYNGLQLYLHYLKKVARWDYVLVTFGWNETPDMQQLEFRLRNPPISNAVLRKLRDEARHLRVYNVLETAVIKATSSASRPLRDKEVEKQYAVYYRKLVQEIRKSGARVIVSAVITRPGDAVMADGLRETNAIARRIAQSEGAVWLDVNQAFSESGSKIGWYDDWHYDSRGHETVAKELARVLTPYVCADER